MRFLLVFHSDKAAQWRFLDSAALPMAVPDRAALPGILNACPAQTLAWLLGRYAFAAAQDPEAAQILVYALEADAPYIAAGDDYLGPWLEMFMAEHQPCGYIALRQARDAVAAPALAEIWALAAEPLRSDQPGCQQTLGLIRGQAAAAETAVDTATRSPEPAKADPASERPAAMPIET
ncbi:hypothetical protein HOY34_04275 [Xinfangfangia sp. D13-10-4-6]|uniref:hypothetical protein n=1 Tax=Pseudogemmobacter hezensis TaxID=2737662 RepID=UPI001553BBE2|nr:hypothetical protein [Pseudogemmobacter hezensis]NPD14414.1 hypothetical protein [Pseudogemmobacter hezensis]